MERVHAVTLQHAHVLAEHPAQTVRTLPAHGPAQIVAEADGTIDPHRRHERGPWFRPAPAPESALSGSSPGRRAGLVGCNI